MNNARKDGSITYSSVGKVDPELEGYNGKTWNRMGGSPSLEGAPSGGDNAWGVSAGEVGGPREATRSMGNTTTQTERGYTTRQGAGNDGTWLDPNVGGPQWNMVDEGSGDEMTPNQYGELATGGQGLFNSRDIGQMPLGAVRSMLGLGGGGPTGKNYTPSATWKDGKFQMADLYDYSKMHPWLWKLLKGAGNMILPGSASIGDAVVQYGVPRGVGDGKPNNASIHRVQ